MLLSSAEYGDTLLQLMQQLHSVSLVWDMFIDDMRRK